MQKKTKIAIAGTSALALGAGVFLWIHTSVGRKIIRIAKGFIGQHETGTNTGFVNPVFEQMMKQLGGWYSGAEWCMAFARMVWLIALRGKKRLIASRLLNPSTQQSFVNVQRDNSGLLHISSKPKPGSIIIWRSRNQPSKGHAGIYIGKIAGKYFFIEGNKNDAVRLTQYIDYNVISNDLRFRGFINF